MSRITKGRYNWNNSSVVGFEIDRTGDGFSPLMASMRGITETPEGRKIARNASAAAIEIFNVETGKKARQLTYKSTRKLWRKAIGQAGSYKTKAFANKFGFGAMTGINYKKKPVLSISHLIERGFQHVKSGWVKSRPYRETAFRQNERKVRDKTEEGISWGIQQYMRTGKAPTKGQMKRMMKR